MKKFIWILIIAIVICSFGCIEWVLEEYIPWNTVPNGNSEPKVWTDYDVQWVIPGRINGKPYLHQMRKSKTTHGVESQFIELRWN
jgi:hypothetical protein